MSLHRRTTPMRRRSKPSSYFQAAMQALESRVMLSGVAPLITAPMVFGVRPQSPFIFHVTAAGDLPMTFGAVGLPAGLTLNPQTGMITGKLDQNATYDLTLTASNSAGSTEQKFRVVVGNKIELTPAMGWNSWTVWQGFVTQAKIQSQANAMVSSGLINYGWTYINIDAGWEDGRTALGQPMKANPYTFPDIAGLSNSIHSMGLKFGLYTVPQAKGFAYEAAGTAGINIWPDAKQYAAWGADYVKYDGVPPTQQQIQQMGEALKATGRDIIYSVSYFGGFKASPGNTTFYPSVSNSWRTASDISDFYSLIIKAGIDSEQPWLNYSGPGHWNDPDNLEIGVVGNGQGLHKSNLTQNQQQSQMTIWVMDAAPLLLGNDLTQLTPATMSLITNPEVLAIDQDPLGIQSRPVKGNNVIQSRPLYDGSTALEFLNLGNTAGNMSVNFADLGLSGPQVVRDLWAKKDLGTYNGTFTVNVPAGGSFLLKLSAATPGAPQITGQPVNKDVNVNGTATYAVTATGAGILSYQWLKNNVAIPGANAPTYTTPAAVATDDGAVFRCVVSNSIGKIISYEADLNVHGLMRTLSDGFYFHATSGFYNNTVNLNANVQGYSLQIANTTYTKGIGTQSPSEVDFFLDRQEGTFQALVGLNAGNQKGSAYFQVWLDGVKVFTTGLVTGTMPAIPISIDVTGANILQLIVTNGGATNAYGMADWVNTAITSSLIQVTNQPPTLGNISKSTNQNVPVNFSTADFTAAFTDPNTGGALQNIAITALPVGSLSLNGVAVTLNQVIPAAQIPTLTYSPPTDFLGPDSFGWIGSDQFATATAAAAVNLTVLPIPVAPDAPNLLSATAASSSSVQLAWADSSVSPNTASGYLIWISTDGTTFSQVAIAAAGVNSISIPNLTANTPYSFQMTGTNAAGNSPPSNILGVVTPPAAPGIFTAVGGNGTADLSWTAPAGATGYNVKRATVAGGPYTTIAANIGDLALADSGLTNGVTYYYVISAVGAGGESANSAQKSVAPLAPPVAPTGLSATPGNGQVALSWNAVPGAIGYTVSYGTTAGGPYDTTLPITAATTKTIAGLTNGVTYYFVVNASNASGTSDNSAQHSATPTQSTKKIDFPAGFAAAGNSLKLNGTAKITGSNLVLNDNRINQVASAYFTTPLNITNFSTTFNFQITGTWPLGVGFTFVIQNAGLTAMGASGSGLGYGPSAPGGTGGIPNSVAVKFDVLHSVSGNGAVDVFTNGAYPGSGIDLGGTGFNLRSYDPAQAKITYDGTTLTLVLTDLVTHATATKSFTINIPGIVGGNTALVGFTAAGGALTANQVIQTWTYDSPF